MNNLDLIILFKSDGWPLRAAHHFAIAFDGQPVRLQTKICYQPLDGYLVRNVSTLAVDLDLQARSPSASFNPAE